MVSKGTAAVAAHRKSGPGKATSAALVLLILAGVGLVIGGIVVNQQAIEEPNVEKAVEKRRLGWWLYFAALVDLIVTLIAIYAVFKR